MTEKRRAEKRAVVIHFIIFLLFSLVPIFTIPVNRRLFFQRQREREREAAARRFYTGGAVARFFFF